MRDVVVIGGGISGIGVALEAARAGFTVTLLEKGGWGAATSANSLRIMHGGVRYLQSLNVVRTLESLRDQQFLKRAYPQAVEPLVCFLALRWRQIANPCTVGPLALGYNMVSRLTIGESRHAALCSRSGLPEPLSWLPEASSRFFRWTECLLTDPAVLAAALVREAEALGAQCFAGTAVLGVEDTPTGITVHSSERSFEARAVVDATGPWLGSVSGLPGWPGQQWAKGFNLLVSHRLVRRCAVGVFGKEGRAFFAVPRGDLTALGTWYEPFSGAPDDLSVSEEEVGRFVGALNEALPSLSLRREDIVQLEAGVLPAVAVAPRIRLVGRERIAVRGRVVQVVSTKYTTFRSQGRRVVEVLRSVLANSPSSRRV